MMTLMMMTMIASTRFLDDLIFLVEGERRSDGSEACTLGKGVNCRRNEFVLLYTVN